VCLWARLGVYTVVAVDFVELLLFATECVCACVCVCVCVCGRESACVSERKRKNVCVRERDTYT